MKTFLLAAILFFSCSGLSATPQVPDILIFDGQTYPLFSNPLEDYLNTEGYNEKDDRGCNSSSCWRGYVATWTIRNDSLFLTQIERCGIYASAGVLTGVECNQADTSKIIRHLIREFKGRETFFPWFSGELRSPEGRMIEYIHGEYLSKYERELLVKIESGILTGVYTVNNEISDSHELDRFNYELIQDSLFHYIATGLDWKKVGGDMICDSDYLITINKRGRVTRLRYEPMSDESKWESFWWNLNYSDCRRTLKRPIRNLNLKKMLTHGGQIPRIVKLVISYSDDANELSLYK